MKLGAKFTAIAIVLLAFTLTLRAEPVSQLKPT